MKKERIICEFCEKNIIKDNDFIVGFHFWIGGLSKEKELLLELLEKGRNTERISQTCEKWCSITGYSPRTFYVWRKLYKSQKVQKVPKHIIFYCCYRCLEMFRRYNLEKDKERIYDLLKNFKRNEYGKTNN